MLQKEKEIDVLKYKNHELLSDVNTEKQINEKLLQIINEELNIKYTKLDEEITVNYFKKESTLSKLLQQVTTLYDGIINILEKQDRVINDNKIKTKQIQTLQEEVSLKVKEINYLEERYHAMSNSKLGKLTIKYWAMRRKKV